MDKRLTELEVKLAFAEDLLEALNLAVFRQQERIDALEGALRELRQIVQLAQPAEPRSLPDERPPHY